MNRLDERVAEVIEQLGNDDEFRQALIDALPMKSMIEAGIKDPESPIGKAVTAEIVRVFEETEVIDGEVVGNAMSSRDWRQIIPEVCRSPQMQEAIISAIKEYIDGLDGDELPFSEEVDRQLGNKESIEALLAEESVQEKIRETVRNYLENFDVTDDESLMDSIGEAAFGKDRVKSVVEAHYDLIDQKITAAIPDAIERALEDDDILTEAIQSALGSSRTLKDEVNRAVSDALRDGTFRDAIAKSITAKLEQLFS